LSVAVSSSSSASRSKRQYAARAKAKKKEEWDDDSDDGEEEDEWKEEGEEEDDEDDDEDDEDEEDDEAATTWEVKAILDDKKQKGVQLYKVAWVPEEGKRATGATWEPIGSLKGCEWALQQYKDNKTRSRKKAHESIAKKSCQNDSDSEDQPLIELLQNPETTTTTTTTNTTTTTTTTTITAATTIAAATTTTVINTDIACPNSGRTSVQAIYDHLSKQPEWAKASWTKKWDAATFQFNSQAVIGSRDNGRKRRRT
jgi:hypothetical protein